jgi:hypothetical protein
MINSEVHELLNSVTGGIKNLDAKTVRKAARKLRKITETPERPEEIPDEPRCDCGHFFEICNFPNCASGSQVV